MLLIYSPQCLEYAAPGHPESPNRLRATVTLLQKRAHTWLTPTPCTDADISRVHPPALVAALQHGEFFDADTPFLPGIYDHALRAAGGAILAAEHGTAGQPSFSLMRPPGHHAGRERIMGFCYLNNIAIAVARLLAGPVRVAAGPLMAGLTRVAILDFDCHHGNGTEEIFRDDPRVLFASLHQSPCYPYTGLESRGNCLNFPLPAGTRPPAFLAALDRALERVAAFGPQVLAVSAGFDAYKRDPITHMALEIDTFYQIGLRLASLQRPMFAVLEGGYAAEFPHCVEAFIDGWEQGGPPPHAGAGR